ncbi:zinc finger protein Xfin isoform X1 [Thunnus albacares]|uniref:zinc finger protein Xfin isoform X1 n=1 Tax=Thunnus albacares TaxID=8236 RepID=UPI001CF683C0|nr:zinc finger protein Xfin isoform X1 [Thunnus albacares]
MMSLQRYRDISPVTLQVVGGAESSLYCEQAEGVAGHVEGGANLVESFLVEVYRCKLCQFTCGLKTAIGSHLQLRHRPPELTCLGGTEEEAGLRQGASPYRLDLSGESKQSDEDEDFLLYNMLGSMTPPTCDITEGGLQVAHTCEVSTLFEEESSIFPLKGASVDLSCPINPPATQEEMAQSAHLMTLGLCRISAARPPPPPPAARSTQHRPPTDDSTHLPPCGSTDGVQTPKTRHLPCVLCPLTLPSRRLLDVHVRSHRAAGGFSCVCCSLTADSWEQLEPHWRTHCRRRRRREQQKKKREASRPFSCPLCLKTFRNAASRNAHQQTHADRSERRRRQLIGRAGRKKAKHLDREPNQSETCVPASPCDITCCCSRTQTGSLQNVSDSRKRTRKKTEEEEKCGEETTRFCCSLCNRKFSTKLTLRRHLGVHGGDKPFTCPHCPYSSRLKASLLQHLRTHTGEKPYRCAQCPYASIDRSSLLRHCRTHSQEKPYSCDHCDYSSIQKKSLDLHTRRHHTGEAFPCQQCEYSSPDRQLLLRHVRRHHTPPV